MARIDMTDLHTHILPQIDDGAKDVKMSLQLLAAQQRVGVSQIVCTPHFHFERQNLDDFVQKRYESAKKLAKTLSAYPNFRIGLKFGAEVRISPKVLECDQKQLCFQGTNVMLLEMPNSAVNRLWFEQGCWSCVELREDGTLAGPNFEQLSALQSAVSCRITASGGISCMDDLRRLCDMGLYAAICGKSIYSETVNLKEAVEVCEHA